MELRTSHPVADSCAPWLLGAALPAPHLQSPRVRLPRGCGGHSQREGSTAALRPWLLWPHRPRRCWGQRPGPKPHPQRGGDHLFLSQRWAQGCPLALWLQQAVSRVQGRHPRVQAPKVRLPHCTSWPDPSPGLRPSGSTGSLQPGLSWDSGGPRPPAHAWSRRVWPWGWGAAAAKSDPWGGGRLDLPGVAAPHLHGRPGASRRAAPGRGMQPPLGNTGGRSPRAAH